MGEFLKAEELATAGATTLPGAYYTSAGLFEQEQERIFQRRWLCAGREEWIPRTGDYFLRSLGTESVIVVRDRDGSVRAHHNVCRHRGTRLCESAQGSFSGAIRCPYHAWSYALDGSLRGAPSMDGVPGFDAAEYPLHSAPVATWEGFIFLALGTPDEPFEQSHAPLIGKWPQYGLPHLRSARRIDYDVRANWKLLFENYSECYHCPPVHPSLVRRSPATSGRNDLITGPFLGGYMEINPGADLTESSRRCGIPVGELPEDELRRVYYYALFPNLLLSLHPTYVMVHTLWPVAPNHTRIECEWLFHADAAAEPGFDPDDAVSFWDRTNREDWHICEQSQLGVSSRAYTPSPYSPRESLCAAFDAEVLRALDA
jgi:Rieske 2Fe-2S family protein